MEEHIWVAVFIKLILLPIRTPTRMFWVGCCMTSPPPLSPCKWHTNIECTVTTFLFHTLHICCSSKPGFVLETSFKLQACSTSSLVNRRLLSVSPDVRLYGTYRKLGSCCRTDVIWANQNFLPRVVNLVNVNLVIWVKLFSRVVTWANLGGSKGGGRTEARRSRMEEGIRFGK